MRGRERPATPMLNIATIVIQVIPQSTLLSTRRLIADLGSYWQPQPQSTAYCEITTWAVAKANFTAPVVLGWAMISIMMCCMQCDSRSQSGHIHPVAQPLPTPERTVQSATIRGLLNTSEGKWTPC